MKKSLKFIGKDGNEYMFKTEPNPLNNNQMWWIEPLTGMYAGTVREAKIVMADIKKSCVILEEK